MGSYLSTPKTNKHFEDGENERLRFGLCSMQGWRISMEDAHVAVPNLDDSTSFFGVYDGHGGKTVAKFCAKYLHTQFVKDDAYKAGDIGTSLQKAFFRMDEMMQGQRGWRELAALDDKTSDMVAGLNPVASDSVNQGDDWPLEEGPHSDFTGPSSGSTACVAVIRKNQLVVANAGDSRCVISRNGKAYNLSRDHKPEIDAEKERIRNAGGFVLSGRVNGILNLSRAIGDMEMKQNEDLPPEKQMISACPDINMVEVCDDNDFIVLACDGIWECMSSQEVVDFICEHINTEPSLSVICGKLLDRCLSPSATEMFAGGTDNMTIILVHLKPSSSVSTENDQSTETVGGPEDGDQVGEHEIDQVGEPKIDGVEASDSNIS